jgi:hypothetical protein
MVTTSSDDTGTCGDSQSKELLKPLSAVYMFEKALGNHTVVFAFVS